MTRPATSSETRPLLDWMCLRHPDSPKKRVKHWFEEGRVLLNGRVVRQFHTPSADPGETLALQGEGGLASVRAPLRVTKPVQIGPKLAVIYLDSDVCVVDKPAGLLSVPAPGRRDESVIDLLAAWLKKEGASGKALKVHRLDEHTSGLMCFALNDTAQEALIGQVRGHRFGRQYVAFAHGEPGTESGTWVHHLKLSRGSRQFIASEGNENAERAVTHFQVEAVYELAFAPDGVSRTVSRLRLTLETGLKHQIRIQAAEVGLPLLGDRVYHPLYDLEKQKRPPRYMPKADRQALHAAHLGITHPASGQALAWSSQLPADLRKLEAGLAKCKR